MARHLSQRAAWALASLALLLPLLAADELCADGEPPCWTVEDYWPYKECKPECERQICDRGYGAWVSEEVCCARGVAFPDGCQTRPEECWVVESFALKTCIQDERKCLQGYGVWPSRAACCAASFRQECVELPEADEPCYIIDTYWPARLCRESSTLCGPEAASAGLQSWDSEDACCAIGAAFGEGCSSAPPPTPCWMVDSYHPVQRCRMVDDIAECNRGWGVYESQDICCAPNVAFPEGCSVETATPNATTDMPGDTAAMPTPMTPAASATTTNGALPRVPPLPTPGSTIQLPTPVPAAEAAMRDNATLAAAAAGAAVPPATIPSEEVPDVAVDVDTQPRPGNPAVAVTVKPKQQDEEGSP